MSNILYIILGMDVQHVYITFDSVLFYLLLIAYRPNFYSMHGSIVLQMSANKYVKCMQDVKKLSTIIKTDIASYMDSFEIVHFIKNSRH